MNQTEQFGDVTEHRAYDPIYDRFLLRWDARIDGGVICVHDHWGISWIDAADPLTHLDNMRIAAARVIEHQRKLAIRRQKRRLDKRKV